MGESDNNKTYSVLQPTSLPLNQHTFPRGQPNSDSRLLNYDYMDGESTAVTAAAVSPTTGVNFVGCQSGQQNVLDSQSINRHYGPEENGCYLPTTMQNCSPTARTDPIAGLAQLAEKASFTAEPSDFGDTRSGIHSRNSLPRLDRNYSFPTSPTSRNPMMERAISAYEHYGESFQGSFMGESMSNSLYSVGGSTMSDIDLSRHHKRRQQCPSTYMYHDQVSDHHYDQYKYPDEIGRRTYTYYEILTKDKSGVIPNVTVSNPDPKSKTPQFFAPAKSLSEEILKQTISTFGKILSPTEGEDGRRDIDKWSSTTDNRKDKLCPSTKGAAARSSTEQSGDDRLCPCKWMGCDAIYSEQEDLVRHIEKVHIDQRKADDLYICYWEQCTRQTKPFNARYKLVIHMRVHSGEKPNKCTVSEQLLLKCEGRERVR